MLPTDSRDFDKSRRTHEPNYAFHLVSYLSHELFLCSQFESQVTVFGPPAILPTLTFYSLHKNHKRSFNQSIDRNSSQMLLSRISCIMLHSHSAFTCQVIT